MSTSLTNTSQLTSNGQLQWLSQNTITSDTTQLITTDDVIITDLTGCSIISERDSVTHEIKTLVIKTGTVTVFAEIVSVDIVDSISFIINSKDEVGITLIFISAIDMQNAFQKVENICNNIDVPVC